MLPSLVEIQGVVQGALQFIALLIDLIAAGIITYAVGHGVVYYLSRRRRAREIEVINNVRLSLGKSLVLGLEFLIGADILRTSVSPTWENLGLLGAIIVLRSVLNLFLEWELRQLPGEPNTLAPPPEQGDDGG